MVKRARHTKEHRAWRALLLERDTGCLVCGQVRLANAHHIIPNNFKEYRYTLDNGMLLCPSHHSMGKFSAHKHPIWFFKWMAANQPELLNIALTRLKEIEDAP